MGLFCARNHIEPVSRVQLPCNTRFHKVIELTSVKKVEVQSNIWDSSHGPHPSLLHPLSCLQIHRLLVPYLCKAIDTLYCPWGQLKKRCQLIIKKPATSVFFGGGGSTQGERVNSYISMSKQGRGKTRVRGNKIQKEHEHLQHHHRSKTRS